MLPLGIEVLNFNPKIIWQNLTNNPIHMPNTVNHEFFLLVLFQLILRHIRDAKIKLLQIFSLKNITVQFDERSRI